MTSLYRNLLASLTMLICFTGTASATAPPPMSQEALDAWFHGKSAGEVNDGRLTFLLSQPDKPVHHHQNFIRITQESLSSGWTDLEQCHDNLDAVPRAQITFRDGFIRNLRIRETLAIEAAWVEGASVQLRDIQAGARLCLSAQTRALNSVGNGYFTLNNGPYMRKFLDGYYPMQVSLRLEYPARLLQIIDISPAEQPGFHVSLEAGSINIDILFEGELRTQVQFERLR